MLRGGLGGLGTRGGLGSIDAPDSPSVSLRGFRAQDQGGAYVAATTRVNIAGLNSICGAEPMVAMSVAGIAGGATGQMLVVVPEYFEVAGTITRLVTRTNGTIGSAGVPKLKMGVWSTGELGGSGALAGSFYPDRRRGQSGDLALLPGANRLLESIVSISVAAKTYMWFGLVVNAAAAANAHTIPGIRRNALYPIHGYTFDATTPTTIAQDALTFSVGWRHAVTYVSSDDLPDPFPQSAPVALADGAAIDTFNIPAIGYGWVPA